MTPNEVITRLDAIATERYPMITELDVEALKIAMDIVKEKESTTKNDLEVERHKQNIKAYAHDFGVSEEQAEKELRVTIKNDLEVDCISRERALEPYKILENTDTLSVYTIRRNLAELPSVTPQEPTDKNFTKADIDAIVKAINAHWELIIDEIRAEIRKLDDINPDYPMDRTIHISRNEVLAILDKYKTESEDQDGQTSN